MSISLEDISGQSESAQVSSSISERVFWSVFIKNLARIGIDITLSDDFMSIYAAHVDSVSWCDAMYTAFLHPNSCKIKLSEYKTKQLDKIKAQKMAFVRSMIDFGFSKRQIADMHALVFSEIKDRRGGTRKGAGRVKVLDAKPVSLTLDNETIDRLNVIGKGNMSAAVRLLAMMHQENN